MYMFVFFFKQKTAYEMRISDWSSDVCSSDLPARPQIPERREHIGIPLLTRCIGVVSRLRMFISDVRAQPDKRSEEHTSELQSLMRISYAVFCLKKKKTTKKNPIILKLLHITTHILSPHM